jgi:hypothetical protein
MKLITIRCIIRHRPAPVRGAVVVRCKNADYCALSQLSITAAHLDTGHRSQYIIPQIGLIAISNGRVIIQIPIVRRLI